MKIKPFSSSDDMVRAIREEALNTVEIIQTWGDHCAEQKLAAIEGALTLLVCLEGALVNDDDDCE